MDTSSVTVNAECGNIVCGGITGSPESRNTHVNRLCLATVEKGLAENFPGSNVYIKGEELVWRRRPPPAELAGCRFDLENADRSWRRHSRLREEDRRSNKHAEGRKALNNTENRGT